MAIKSKPPAESAVEENVYKIFPNDLNAERTVFGGVVMGLCDRTALIVAERHSGTTCVTASVDSLHFLAPCHAGDTLILKAAVNRAWHSSMEIGVRLVAENSHTGERRHVLSAYFTFVALDDAGKPCRVPRVRPQTAAEKRRHRAAQLRRDDRLKTRERIAKLQA